MVPDAVYTRILKGIDPHSMPKADVVTEVIIQLKKVTGKSFSERSVLVPYLRTPVKDTKKFHTAISISCFVEAANSASRAVVNCLPFAVSMYLF